MQIIDSERYVLRTHLSGTGAEVPGDDLETGEMGIVVGLVAGGNSGYEDILVLKVYDRLVSLSDPSCTWSAATYFKVRRLRPSDAITMIVK